MAIMPEELTVRVGQPAELDRIIDAHFAVFADEAVSRWILPDETQRAAFAEHYKESIASSLRDDELLVAQLPDGELSGLSLWKTLVSAERVRREAAEIEQSVTTDSTLAHRRMATLVSLTAERHPDEPHLYLASMGVPPHARGRGIGSVLLRHRLGRADAERQATYLEASTERSQALYARHGFGPVGSPILVAAEGPRLQPMWREPRPA